VAFGDPLYFQPRIKKGQPAPDPSAKEVLGEGVARLPATRKEVEGIARLFPDHQVVLGGDVTEEKVKEAVPGASLVHFAVHGLVNERSPLGSALVLSPSKKPGQGGRNGLLQAWKVMESLPLDADLVTLSACNTALGRQVSGEGLIGLTRAFQYAGARSVVATLWGISDRSTAGFMTEFYGALRAGQSKDEALRTAQLAQIRSSKPQPFYWAAFQLFGDWQ
jgi:CHAT domain-containing protein